MFTDEPMKLVQRFAHLILIGLILTACTGIAQPSATTSFPTQPAADAEVEPQVLDFHNWDTYIDPAILTDFEKKYEAKINYTTYSSNANLREDVQANPGLYDLIVPTNDMLEIMRREGLLAPLNKENIPNWKNIDPSFLNPPFDPGNRYCAPYQWGTAGIGYNLKKTGREITKWADLFDPAFEGRVALLDDPRTPFAAVLLILGYSPNTTNRFEVEQARDFLIQHAKQIRTYTRNAGQELLANGDVDITMEWSGDIFQAMTKHPDLRYVIPEEGTIVWVDSICVPANARHPALAQEFINYLLEPKVGAALSNYIHYASPNRAALPLINEADRNNLALYPPDSFRKLLFFQADLGPDVTAFYYAAWDQVIKLHQ